MTAPLSLGDLVELDQVRRLGSASPTAARRRWRGPGRRRWPRRSPRTRPAGRPGRRWRRPASTARAPRRTPRRPRSAPSRRPPARPAAPPRARRGSRPGRPSRAVLAGEQAVLEREERQHAEPELLAGRHDLVLDRAVEQRVAVLHRHEALEPGGAGGPVGVGDLPAGDVRAAHVADLALAHELGQRRQRLLDRRDPVGLVELVEVDVVGAEPPQDASTARRT